MPRIPAYPGVYRQETPSGVREIAAVATAITAFVGAAVRGPLDRAVAIDSFADYFRRFGGLSRSAPMGYAVSQFFQNGGNAAIVVRVANGATTASVALPAGAGMLVLRAASPGVWGSTLTATVTDGDPTFLDAFDLGIEERDPISGRSLAREIFPGLTVDKADPRYVGAVLAAGSALVFLDGDPPARRPAPVSMEFGAASDGETIGDADIAGEAKAATRGGVHALDAVDLVNIVCIPPLAMDTDVGSVTHNAVLRYARSRRAVYLIDPPLAWSRGITGVATMEAEFDALVDKRDNGALIYPAIRCADPLRDNQPATFAPSGAVAGVMARTDTQRGVWKPAAGLDAGLTGVLDLAVRLSDDRMGNLNRRGIVCLRTAPGAGRVIWGARTLRGADALADPFRYLAVRRTAYFIENSVLRGTQWCASERNAEPLWSQIRSSVETFMRGLFRQGAFVGADPDAAYWVRCDRETTTVDDANRGVVNILIGFAPSKPAEFVVIRIQQSTGQDAA